MGVLDEVASSVAEVRLLFRLLFPVVPLGAPPNDVTSRCSGWDGVGIGFAEEDNVTPPAPLSLDGRGGNLGLASNVREYRFVSLLGSTKQE